MHFGWYTNECTLADSVSFSLGPGNWHTCNTHKLQSSDLLLHYQEDIGWQSDTSLSSTHHTGQLIFTASKQIAHLGLRWYKSKMIHSRSPICDTSCGLRSNCVVWHTTEVHLLYINLSAWVVTMPRKTESSILQTSNTSNTTAGGRVDDNQWHMITVTSLIDGPGFQMFVDGAYAGRLRTNVTTDSESFAAHLSFDTCMTVRVVSLEAIYAVWVMTSKTRSTSFLALFAMSSNFGCRTACLASLNSEKKLATGHVVMALEQPEVVPAATDSVTWYGVWAEVN